MAGAERHASAKVELERGFNRHFAAKHLLSDRFGTAVGFLVYLGLLPPLYRLGRSDLMLMAVACSLLSPWPLYLSLLGRREFYLRFRDYILLAHFFFHYACGGQLARHVRLHPKLPHASAPSFLLGFALSSTLPWQAIDSMLFRMRARHFLLLKPLVLLMVAPLDANLCQLACANMPDEAHYFDRAASLLRSLFNGFAPLAPALAAADRDDSTVSCFKLQLFAQLLFSYALPAALLFKQERQMLRSFLAEERRRLRAAHREAEAVAPAGGQPAALPGASSDCSPSGAAEAQSPAQTGACPSTAAPAAGTAAAAAAAAAAEAAAQQRRLALAAVRGDTPYAWWLLPCVLSSIGWHLIDMLLSLSR